MFTQIINSIINGTITKLITTYHNWSHLKFYFVVSLIFLLLLGFLYKDTVVMLASDLISNQIQFRECRDIEGLSKYMNETVKKDKIINSYTVYLYQPINSSIYKKLVVSDDTIIMHSPVLQGIYLRTQPTINKELELHSYYLANRDEFMSHEDTKYWSMNGADTRLGYALKIDSKVIGEVWIDFKVNPTPLELERVLKEVSPALYTYIL